MVSYAPTIFVVDDDASARESVAALAEAHGVFTKDFASAEEFLADSEGADFGCLVVDVRLGGMSGLELLKTLHNRGPHPPVVVITAFAHVGLAVEAMSEGALTVLQKPCGEHELWDNINRALRLDAASHEVRLRRQRAQDGIRSLTPGERAVLRGILLGQPNKVIARSLSIGLRTVELRRHALFQKLQVDSLVELVRLVFEAQFDELSPWQGVP